MGAGIVLIHDREGCVARVPDGKSRRLLRAHLPRIADVAATVGSGDAFLAGFIASWIHTREPEAALRLAVATGAANALHLGAGVFDQEDVDAFSRRVEIEELTV